MGYFFSPQLKRRIDSLLARQTFDLIMVHCSSVAPYVAAADGPKVLDFGDMDSQKWLLYASHRPLPLSAGYWLEGRKLERAEKALARQFDLCTCTTLAELDTLRGYGTGVATDWFPNGVDAEYFSPAPGKLKLPRVTRLEDPEDGLAFDFLSPDAPPLSVASPLPGGPCRALD